MCLISSRVLTKARYIQRGIHLHDESSFSPSRNNREWVINVDLHHVIEDGVCYVLRKTAPGVVAPFLLDDRG